MNIPSFLKKAPVLKLILGLVVFVITVFLLLSLSFTSSFYPEDVDYIGVYSGEGDQNTYFIGLHPLIEEKTMGIVITEYDNYQDQSRCMIIVPEETENISFLQVQEGDDMQYPDKLAESTNTLRIPYDTYENLTMAEESGGILLVKPDLIDNYYGIEIFVPGWIRQTSPSQVSIVVPLLSVGRGEIPGVEPVTRYIVQVSLPKNYELINSIPKSTHFKVTGNNYALYQFDMNASESDLMLTLENRFITRDINNFRILLSTLLGFSTMFCITNTIDIISRKEEIFNKKSD